MHDQEKISNKKYEELDMNTLPRGETADVYLVFEELTNESNQ